MKLIKQVKGSVQVVEISFVLPFAMAVVLTLVYFAFSAFIKVYIVSVVQSTVNELENSVGKDAGLYWQIKEDYLKEEKLDEISQKFSDKLKRISILPGSRLEGSVSITSRAHIPYITVSAQAFYFGKSLFSVTEDRRVCIPEEYVLTCDFGKTLENDFEELKEIYDEIF